MFLVFFFSQSNIRLFSTLEFYSHVLLTHNLWLIDIHFFSRYPFKETEFHIYLKNASIILSHLINLTVFKRARADIPLNSQCLIVVCSPWLQILLLISPLLLLYSSLPCIYILLHFFSLLKDIVTPICHSSLFLLCPYS